MNVFFLAACEIDFVFTNRQYFLYLEESVSRCEKDRHEGIGLD